MKISKYILDGKGKPRYLEIMQEFSRTFHDFSRLQVVDGIFQGNRWETTNITLPSIMDNPKAVTIEALRIYTIHCIFKSSGYRPDTHDNGYGQWARDVYFDECSIFAPITNTQKEKLSKALDFIGEASGDWDLEARFSNRLNKKDTLDIKFLDSSVKKLNNLWDLGNDKEGLSNLLDYSFKALCATVGDEKNGYLILYAPPKAGPPRTLCEFRVKKSI